MSSTARVKRPFAGAAADPSQRQITSFFGAQSGAPVVAETARQQQQQQQQQQPALPANVQSNLLSVGMRIRKSVPEGYKTEGPSAFKLWTDNTTPNAPKIRSNTTRVASRELLPFCGINKVGGFESQPAFSHDDLVPDEDAVPELTMSQETADGSEAATPSRKRIYDDDEDAQQLIGGELSPGSRGNARLMAVPHSRMKKGTAHRNVGQENRKVDQDFEEAEFLVFNDEQDLDMVI